MLNVASRFKKEEGSCYLLFVPCANPSYQQHKQGRRFTAIFLFSVALRFKNEEGSFYLVSSVPCANPSDRQHKRGRRFITMFLFSVASVTLEERGRSMLCIPCYVLFCHVRILEGLYDLTSIESNQLLGIRIDLNESIRQKFSPPVTFICHLTSGKSSSAKRTSGESEVFDPRADSNRLCFKTIQLSLGVLNMSANIKAFHVW